MRNRSAAASSSRSSPGGPPSARGHTLRSRVFLASFISTLSLCCLHCSAGSCPGTSSCEPVGAAGEGGEGGAGGDGGGDVGGSGGEGGGAPPGCEPVEDEPIATGCGVYVASGATGNGSQLSPYGTVTQAVAELGSAKRIYICGGETFTGSIDLPSDVSIYGGMDCAAWVFRSANPKPEILGTADKPTIEITGGQASTLRFLRVTAAPAVEAGKSSVAILANGSETTIQECELRADAGAEGAAGEAQAKPATPGTANGSNGMVGCGASVGPLTGGVPGQNTCDSELVDGGFGGLGTNTGNGGTGDAGSPTDAVFGLGGKREDGTACGNGGQGYSGAAGTPGGGATESDAGELSASGYLPPTAPAGANAGGFGQGGGGGGGANACSNAGPSGGGGGAGGCGGSPGNGGQGGGGSFALVALSASVTLEDSALFAGSGGGGGAGDAGQPGMDGGGAGQAGGPTGACNGGPGGNGGQGGAGGGGRGGPSVGIAWVGEQPMEVGAIMIDIAATAAVGGLGGNGGAGNIGGTGADGALEDRLAWP